MHEIFGGDMLAPTSQLLRTLDRHTMLDPFGLRETSEQCAQRLSTSQPLVRETDTTYQIAVAAPGLKPEEISVTIDQGVLRVHGESKVEREGWVQRLHVDRAVQLPQSMIDADAIEATHDHGLLSITVPKKSLPEPRRIAVRVTSPETRECGPAVVEPKAQPQGDPKAQEASQ